MAEFVISMLGTVSEKHPKLPWVGQNNNFLKIQEKCTTTNKIIENTNNS